jgi:hypothetical protein
LSRKAELSDGRFRGRSRALVLVGCERPATALCASLALSRFVLYGRRIADDGLYYWVDTLTGLERERVSSALDEIASWGWKHTTDAFLCDEVDSAVAGTLLVEAIDELVSGGIDRARVLKKVRQDRQVWGTWAELRAGALLRTMVFPEAEMLLEDGRSQGAHADLRFLLEGHEDGATSVEIKAIGLSDDEVAFSRRMAPALPKLLPKTGLSHGHAALEAPAPKMTKEMRRAMHKEAAKALREVPLYPTGLRGAAIVGHGSQEHYARRVAGKVAGAVRQLPTTDTCWVAVYWSNGAPMSDVAAAIDWLEIPAHVVGIMLVGSGVAFPHRQIHCFAAVLHRDAADEEPMDVVSLVDLDELAKLVLERFQSSSGVRPTLLKAGQRVLLYRDGSRRIFPFNLLLDRDPEAASAAAEAGVGA